MVCVHCGHNTRVINSRHQKRLNQVWRRRKCQDCGAIFSTEETTAYEAAWAVRGASGDLTPFSRDKLMVSLLRSCQHRKTAQRDAGALANTVIKKLLSSVKDGVVDSQSIAVAAQVALSRFDNAASTHYEAFHTGD